MKKRTILSVLICLIICSIVFVAVACKDNHEHIISLLWSSDDDYHWHDLLCEHSDIVSDKAKHDWNDGVITKSPSCEEDITKEYVCKTCKAKKSVSVPSTEHTFFHKWSKDVSYHWYDATCGHDVITAKAEHEFDSDGFCTICKYFIGEGFSFRLNSDNSSYTLMRAREPVSGEIKIPSTYEGLPITGIGYSAFKDSSDLVSLQMPQSVTSIGDSAFSNCVSLTNIEIPEGVTSIEPYTFYRCISLTSIVIPEGVTSIKAAAFLYCNSLTSVEIPESVTGIEGFAFSDCSSLKSIELPSGLIRIDSFTFSKCVSLTSIEIPSSVKYIGTDTFRYCSGLESITVDADNSRFIGEGNGLIEKERMR